MAQTLDCDLLVIGSGAGGLSAAVTAAHLGLKVIVAEKEPQYGGTTAWSGGWMWIPRNPLATAAGIVEGIEKPQSYLKHELGDPYDEACVLAFLNHGPRMVAFFESNTHLQFIDGNGIPDFHGRTPDASSGGRSIGAAPFDGRKPEGSPLVTMPTGGMVSIEACAPQYLDQSICASGTALFRTGRVGHVPVHSLETSAQPVSRTLQKKGKSL